MILASTTPDELAFQDGRPLLVEAEELANPSLLTRIGRWAGNAVLQSLGKKE